MPIVFRSDAGPCFGWYHAAGGTPRGLGAVLCRPLGLEGVLSYEAFTCLAERLARSGLACLRFDYHGTGDSAGADTDPGRVAAWQASVAAALDELQRRAGCRRLALVGLRSGATLAASVAARRGGVAAMVLWAPLLHGRAWLRELRASGRPAGDGLEAQGSVFTAETLAGLHALDAQPTPGAAPPTRLALFISRDDLPGHGPLPAQWRAAGVQTTLADWPGYAGLLADPGLQPTPQPPADAALAGIVAWLVQADALIPSADAPCAAEADAVAPAPLAHTPLGDVRERPLMFPGGDGQALFGILAEREPGAGASPHADTALLMLNVGTNHRVGPNRLYVTLSRAWAGRGYRALRFDLAGLGDSRAAAGYASRLYSPESTADVRAAMAALAAQGVRHFILVGLCSGAYVAFQTALVDPRVAGLVLINPRRLEWQPGETLASAMQRSYKSSRFYRRALWQPATWARLCRGQVDVRGIASRLLALGRLRLQRLARRLLSLSPPAEHVLAHLRGLCRRGTDVLLVVGEADDGLDYLEYHLGPGARRMRGQPGFRLLTLVGADHTLSQAASQQALIEAVRRHLDARQGRHPGQAGQTGQTGRPAPDGAAADGGTSQSAAGSAQTSASGSR